MVFFQEHKRPVSDYVFLGMPLSRSNSLTYRTARGKKDQKLRPLMSWMLVPIRQIFLQILKSGNCFLNNYFSNINNGLKIQPNNPFKNIKYIPSSLSTHNWYSCKKLLPWLLLCSGLCSSNRCTIESTPLPI